MGILTYFQKSDGLFNVTARDEAYQRMVSGHLRIDLSLANVQLSGINEGIRTINSLLFDQFATNNLDQIRHRVAELQTALAKAENEVRNQQHNSNAAAVLQPLQKLGQSVTALVTALTTDNYVRAIQDGFDGFDGLQKFLAGPSIPDLKPLRDALQEAVQHYKAFGDGLRGSAGEERR